MTTAVAVREPQQAIAEVTALLTKRHDQLISLFAGDEAVVDRMKTLTLHALAQPRLMEKLQRADLATVIEAVRECAALGLMPIPALAEGYFVPYWNSKKGQYDIQFQTGYNGLAKLVRNSGNVLDVSAGVAYANDEFDYDEGSAAFVRHKRALSDRGNRIAAYAIALFPGGIARVRVMDIAEVEQHRKASKAADDGPWVEWYDPMAAKTALRDLCKYLPKSATVERALIGEVEAEERHARPPARPVSATVTRIHERLGVGTSPTTDQPAQADDGAQPSDVSPAPATETPVPESVSPEPATDPVVNAMPAGSGTPDEAGDLAEPSRMQEPATGDAAPESSPPAASTPLDELRLNPSLETFMAFAKSVLGIEGEVAIGELSEADLDQVIAAATTSDDEWKHLHGVLPASVKAPIRAKGLHPSGRAAKAKQRPDAEQLRSALGGGES
jgi:recombination protein RecT